MSGVKERVEEVIATIEELGKQVGRVKEKATDNGMDKDQILTGYLDDLVWDCHDTAQYVRNRLENA